MDHPENTDVAFSAAKELSRAQFRRYRRLRELEAAIEQGQPPPTTFGRWFRRSTDERTLVLFTLALLVVIVVALVFVLEITDQGTETTRTPMITLAGTALGFIGGMVRKEATPSDGGADGNASSRVSPKP